MIPVSCRPHSYLKLIVESSNGIDLEAALGLVTAKQAAGKMRVSRFVVSKKKIGDAGRSKKNAPVARCFFLLKGPPATSQSETASSSQGHNNENRNGQYRAEHRCTTFWATPMHRHHSRTHGEDNLCISSAKGFKALRLDWRLDCSRLRQKSFGDWIPPFSRLHSYAERRVTGASLLTAGMRNHTVSQAWCRGRK